MRILMISKACVVGTYRRKLEEMARAPDLELTVLVPPSWRDERGTLPFEPTPTPGYTLAITPIRLNGHFHLHFYPHLGRWIARTQPDLVHIDEEPYNLATWHAALLSHRAGAIPIFFTWQNILRHYPPPFSWMERAVYRWAHGAIAGNRAAEEILRAKGYTGPTWVIPQFGVDPTLFTPRPPRRDRTTYHIGYVGRLVPEKGILDLLKALAPLESPWTLSLLGSGPLRPEIERLSTELGIASRVHLIPPIPSTQIPAHLRQLDVLVLPSQTRPNWREQFGRVLIEAMACGVPVIGSDSGEIPHVIGNAGLIFPEGNPDALHQALRTLRDDLHLWNELARRGRQRVLDHYTQAQIAQQTLAVYRTLLHHHNPPGSP